MCTVVTTAKVNKFGEFQWTCKWKSKTALLLLKMLINFSSFSHPKNNAKSAVAKWLMNFLLQHLIFYQFSISCSSWYAVRIWDMAPRAGDDGFHEASSTCHEMSMYESSESTSPLCIHYSSNAGRHEHQRTSPTAAIVCRIRPLSVEMRSRVSEPWDYVHCTVYCTP